MREATAHELVVIRLSRVVRRSSGILVFSATAIQISGVSTPSMSRVTIDCFTGGSLAKPPHGVERIAFVGEAVLILPNAS